MVLENRFAPPFLQCNISSLSNELDAITLFEEKKQQARLV